MLAAHLRNVNSLADGGSATQVATGDLPSWLVELGPLGLSAIIGGVVVAAVNHFLTRRRERGAWLRELQVEASEKFRAKAAALNNHVAGGAVDKAIQAPHFEGLDTAIEGIQPLIEALVDECQEMTLIAERRTVLLAAKVMHIFPKLAWQAAILPGTNCEAARKQRETAITAMAALNLDMSAVMRADIGLEDIRPPQSPRPNCWRRIGNRLRALTSRKSLDHLLRYTSMYEPLGFSPVDRGIAGVKPLDVLQSWQVRRLQTDVIPNNTEGYRMDQIMQAVPHASGAITQILTCNGMLAKKANGPWSFGVVRYQSPSAEAAIVKDAVRLVTGHRHAFSTSNLDGWLDADDSIVYRWGTTISATIINPPQPAQSPSPPGD